MNLHVTFLKWGEGLKVFMCYQSMRVRWDTEESKSSLMTFTSNYIRTPTISTQLTGRKIYQKICLWAPFEFDWTKQAEANKKGIIQSKYTILKILIALKYSHSQLHHLLLTMKTHSVLHVYMSITLISIESPSKEDTLHLKK